MATGGETQESNSSLQLRKELSFKFVVEIKDDLSSVTVICADLFGKVYKGIVRDDNKVLAVKKLEPITCGETFEDEVQHIMVLKHDNIVQLIGFCRETERQIDGKNVDVDSSQRFLCYQFLPKESLHGSLFASKAVEGSSSGKPSINQGDWDSRFNIVKGICQGVFFLHKLDCPVIHMNLKLENIWLDETMVPKIVNAGLSRFFGQERTRSYTGKESFRYMAPEYLSSNSEISTKIDIYSLGVMIIQITTGEENCGNTDDRASRKYIDQIRRDWTAEHIASKYPSFDAECLHQVHACIKTGLECVQIDQRNRPSIDEIVDRLNTI